MVEEGQPSRPLILWWSGDVATLVRYVKTKVGNEYFHVMMLIPSQQMKWRYPEINNQLQYKYGISGFLVREYPSEHIHEISNTPELPILVALCNYDGTYNLDTELHSLKDKLRRKDKDINNLLAEVETLREKYKEQTEYIRDLKQGA